MQSGGEAGRTTHHRVDGGLFDGEEAWTIELTATMRAGGFFGGGHGGGPVRFRVGTDISEAKL